MAYGSAMNLNPMGYGPAANNYNTYPAYCPPSPAPFPFSAFPNGPVQATQTASQMLQSFVSLQANWSQFLGANPQLTQSYVSSQAAYSLPSSMPSYSSFGTSDYSSYCAAYQSYSATYQPPAPAYQPPPQTNVAVAVNQEAPATPVEVPVSSGGDGGGDGGDPVILDLNGDNKLDTTGADGKKINFNLFGNGTNVKTEWLKAGTQDGSSTLGM